MIGGVEYRFGERHLEDLLIVTTFSHDVPAARDVVWRLLHDPEVLRRTIPGCESFEPSGGPGAYVATLSAGVGSIRGSFSGTVKLVDIRDGEEYTMDLDGQGPTGFVHGTGNVTLDQGDGVTSISIEGDAQVEGVALLSSRMIETVARLLVGQFFTAVGLEARDAGEPPS